MISSSSLAKELAHKFLVLPMKAYYKNGDPIPEFFKSGLSESEKDSCMFPPQPEFTKSGNIKRFDSRERLRREGDKEIRKHADLFSQKINQDNLDGLCRALLSHTFD